MTGGFDMPVDRTGPGTIDDYIADFPRAVQAVLRRVRRTIRQALPGAEETISYRIPAFRLHGRVVVYFAGWQAHYSLYPANARLVAAFRTELAPYEVSGKGTIRFPLSESVPVDLVAGIARFLAKEAADRAQVGTAAAGRIRVRAAIPARAPAPVRRPRRAR
jgi:uncharacterized protein YdhG (YjbR/CyaY superfamily)